MYSLIANCRLNTPNPRENASFLYLDNNNAARLHHYPNLFAGVVFTYHLPKKDANVVHAFDLGAWPLISEQVHLGYRVVGYPELQGLSKLGKRCG